METFASSRSAGGMALPQRAQPGASPSRPPPTRPGGRRTFERTSRRFLDFVAAPQACSARCSILCQASSAPPSIGLSSSAHDGSGSGGELSKDVLRAQVEILSQLSGKRAPTTSQPLQASEQISEEALSRRLEETNSWAELQTLYARYRSSWKACHLVAAWQRLVKVVLPEEMTDPRFGRLMDLLAHATQEKLGSLEPSSLPWLLFCSSRLREAQPDQLSGMLKAYFRALVHEIGLNLNTYDLPTLQRILASLVRINWAPPASWLLSADREVALHLNSCTDPKKLASILVSLATLGHALPSPALREAVGTNVREVFVRAPPGAETLRPACSVMWSCALLGITLYDRSVQALLKHIQQGARIQPPVLLASPAAGAADSFPTHGSRARAEQALVLDYAQALWALAKFEYEPSQEELTSLLQCTLPYLPSSEPLLLASMLWALADMGVHPPLPWLEAAYDATGKQLHKVGPETGHALLYSLAKLQLPLPPWIDALLQVLEASDLSPLPNPSLVGLVKALHTLKLSPPPGLAHKLEAECNKRLEKVEDMSAPVPAPVPAARGAPPGLVHV